MAKRSKKDKISFDEYYAEALGPRWEVLKGALLADGIHYELSSGLLKPYFLDPASVTAAEALGVEAGEAVLDMCAAPGGKSLVLALALEGKGQLVANERSASRRLRLARVIDSHLPSALSNVVSITSHDATRWGLHEKGVYDRVLLDAPCSSERHVLQNPAHLKRWGPARTRHLAYTQHAMLCAALDAVKVGGTILYSTCALSPLENDQVIEKLVKKRPGRFDLSPLSLPIGEATDWGWQTWPDQSNGVGPIYMARLKRTT